MIDPETPDRGLEGLHDALSGLGIRPHGSAPAISQSILAQRRRAFFRREDSPFAQLNLVRGLDGVLRWQEGGARLPSYNDLRRRANRAAVPTGKIEEQFIFEKLHDSSQVSAALETLDAKLTDATRRALWQWTATGWKQFLPGRAGTLANQKILLFIHGTFSHCDNIFEDLGATSHGRTFLATALEKYDLVLAFNHPTLSVSPAVNAFTLAAYLRDEKGAPATVDTVCHSRGGLVTRWWLEGFADPRTDYRAVFVASPLGGTNLASPPRIKGAFDFLTNVANVLGTGAKMTGYPLLQFVGGLIKILSSVARVTIHSPALDAAVAAIPGLAAQSRVGNNPELRGLRAAGAWQNRAYFAVLCDFRPPPHERWKFWHLFCDPASYTLAWADRATDLVFVDRKSPGAALELSPNDLVVDCASMTDLADSGQKQFFRDTLDLGQSEVIMHTNYFRQKSVLAFVAKAFGW